MSKRGKMIYTPPSVLIELDNIMQGEGFKCRTDAFNIMVKRAKMGEAIERLARNPLGLYKSKKKRGGII